MSPPSAISRTKPLVSAHNPARPPLFGLGVDGAIALVVIVISLSALMIRAFG
jgi:hypothetical protein